MGGRSRRAALEPEAGQDGNLPATSRLEQRQIVKDRICDLVQDVAIPDAGVLREGGLTPMMLAKSGSIAPNATASSAAKCVAILTCE